MKSTYFWVVVRLVWNNIHAQAQDTLTVYRGYALTSNETQLSTYIVQNGINECLCTLNLHFIVPVVEWALLKSKIKSSLQWWEQAALRWTQIPSCTCRGCWSPTSCYSCAHLTESFWTSYPFLRRCTALASSERSSFVQYFAISSSDYNQGV